MGPQQGLANRCDGIIHCRDVMWSHFEEIFVISCTGSWQMKTSGATSDANFLKMALLVSMHVARIYSPSLNMSMFNLWNVYCDVVCIIVLKLTVLWWDPIPANIYSQSWWRHQMETFSALLALCAWNSPVTGEFPAQRPVTRSFDVFFDLRLNIRLSKQSWGWWFWDAIAAIMMSL